MSCMKGYEHPKTTSRGTDKISIRGEVQRVSKELGLCPRTMVTSALLSEVPG